MKGGYTLKDPDGATRYVRYTVSPKTGFLAKVKRVGKNEQAAKDFADDFQIQPHAKKLQSKIGNADKSADDDFSKFRSKIADDDDGEDFFRSKREISDEIKSFVPKDFGPYSGKFRHYKVPNFKTSRRARREIKEEMKVFVPSDDQFDPFSGSFKPYMERKGLSRKQRDVSEISTTPEVEFVEEVALPNNGSVEAVARGLWDVTNNSLQMLPRLSRAIDQIRSIPAVADGSLYRGLAEIGRNMHAKMEARRRTRMDYLQRRRNSRPRLRGLRDFMQRGQALSNPLYQQDFYGLVRHTREAPNAPTPTRRNGNTNSTLQLEDYYTPQSSNLYAQGDYRNYRKDYHVQNRQPGNSNQDITFALEQGAGLPTNNYQDNAGTPQFTPIIPEQQHYNVEQQQHFGPPPHHLNVPVTSSYAVGSFPAHHNPQNAPQEIFTQHNGSPGERQHQHTGSNSFVGIGQHHQHPHGQSAFEGSADFHHPGCGGTSHGDVSSQELSYRPEGDEEVEFGDDVSLDGQNTKNIPNRSNEDVGEISGKPPAVRTKYYVRKFFGR